MSGSNNEDPKEQELANNGSENKVGGDISEDDLKTSDKSDESSIPASDKTEENSMPSPQQEEETIKKKYGGIVPKKPPLISKDHERAYFDSADWALGKQGAQKPKGPLEALRPKLQPTPHHQTRSRRSAYAPADEGEVEGGHTDTSSEEQSTVDGGDENNTTA
ncbi:Endosulphine [Trema orientale]|uniref:Endosulphine n=1 Tax=Trema orientale TaxID=63057 RepID=A0A2P5G0H4_TREOI|nr:Endosulphine [Trema orientale]